MGSWAGWNEEDGLEWKLEKQFPALRSSILSLFVAEEFHFVNPSFNVIRLCGHGENYGGDLLV